MGKKVGLPDFDSESGGGGEGMEGSKCCQLSARIFDLVWPKKSAAEKKFGPEQIGRICGNYE
jgi:hypothetical protein